METHRLLTDPDAAKYIGMSVAFLRRSRSEGRRANHTPGPPFIKIGRAIRYTVADLDAWLEKHRREVA